MTGGMLSSAEASRGLEELQAVSLACGFTFGEAADAAAEMHDLVEKVEGDPGFNSWKRQVLIARFGKRKTRKLMNLTR